MGNSEVGHLTIGSGRILYQDLLRVNRAVRDGSLFENEALVGAFRRARERGGDVHLLGLVSHGGVHSHIDHVQALLELAEREGMASGLDPRLHRRARRLAALGRPRPRGAAGRPDRHRRRPLLRDGPRQALGADAARARRDRRRRGRRTRPTRSPPSRRATTRGVTDEFIVPIVLDGRPRLDPARDAAIFFNFRPDRARQLSEKLGELGVDLTTMTHYRDDFDFPIAFPEQIRRERHGRGARRARGCASCTWPRRRSTRT